MVLFAQGRGVPRDDWGRLGSFLTTDCSQNAGNKYFGNPAMRKVESESSVDFFGIVFSIIDILLKYF